MENTGTGTFAVISPSSGAISAAPVQIPGGLLGLMCPSSVPVVSTVCGEITSNALNTVTAVVQPAGNPSDFSLLGGLTTGTPVMTLPIKVQLQNPLLGSNCYLGSNSSPIVLHPENTVAPTLSVGRFDGDGTPDAASGVLDAIDETGGTQADTSAAIPGANSFTLKQRVGVTGGYRRAQSGRPQRRAAARPVLNSALQP